MKQSIDFQGQTTNKARGVIKHCEREKGSWEHNPNIDPNKISENITLKTFDFKKKVKEINSLKIAGGLQQKTNTFTGFVIFAGNKEKQLDKTKALSYFQKSVKWIEKEFKNKEFYANAQFDETTPHLHIVLPNLIRSKKNGKNYCSSKRRFGYENLNQNQIREKAHNFSYRFWKQVSKEFGFEKIEKQFNSQEEKRGKVNKATYIKLENEKKLTIKVNDLEKQLIREQKRVKTLQEHLNKKKWLKNK